MIKHVGNLISGSSVFSESSLNIWVFMFHKLLKSSLDNFEHYFVSMWDECNSAVVWTFFGIAFLWDWNENWPFPGLWPLLSFSRFAGILSAALSQHHPKLEVKNAYLNHVSCLHFRFRRSSGGNGLVAKLCLTLCDPSDCSPSGSSVHGIFLRQEYWSWVAFSLSRGSSLLWHESTFLVLQVETCIPGRFLTAEPRGKPLNVVL